MKKFLTGFFIFLLIATSVWVYWNYIKVYSEGNRVGVLSKFSYKGDIFKTYEGEVVQPGVRNQQGVMSSQMFRFSVMDPAVAEKLSRLQGQQVELHYIQYRSALPWRGDKYAGQKGQYIVDSIVSSRPTDNINPYGL